MPEPRVGLSDLTITWIRCAPQRQPHRIIPGRARGDGTNLQLIFAIPIRKLYQQLRPADPEVVHFLDLLAIRPGEPQRHVDCRLLG